MKHSLKKIFATIPAILLFMAYSSEENETSQNEVTQSSVSEGCNQW